MVVVDTNVISELMKRVAHPAVLAWAADQAGEVRTTSMTVAEIRWGVARLPAGRRRDELQARADELLADEERALPFDLAAARRYPDVLRRRADAGAPVATADAIIASVCLARGATLATRNVDDFEHVGLTVVNPWGP